MKPIVNILVYCLIIVGAIIGLSSLWMDKPVDASEESTTDNYYKIILDNGSESEPKDHLALVDAPVILQLPDLPRGCEVTSLAMLLNQAGVKVDKLTLAKHIKKDPTTYKVINGKVHFGNPNNGFVGSIYSYNEPGLGVYHGPIATLASQYLPHRVYDLTGDPFSDVETYLGEGQPVWVIVSSTFKKVPASDWETWMTPSGEIKVTKKEHSVLLTGYDENDVYFNDPLSGEKNAHVDKQQFIEAWEQFGSQAITYK